MPLFTPPSITNPSAFAAFVKRQEADRPDPPVPAAVANEQCTAPTGWLYGERRDSIEVHRKRLGIYYTANEQNRYTPEERKLLQALRHVISAGKQWASTDTQPVKPTAVNTRTDVVLDDGDVASQPLMARIYKARSQGTLYRSHLPVVAQLADRVTRSKAAEASDGTSPPPSGT